MIGRYPGVPAALAWSVVLLVVVLLCSDAESRDYLLGHGKTLSVVSVGALLAVLAMTIVGWSVTT
jgi:divalent metal cation (Fe/Co/Zn/Cd) transporter